MPEYAQEKFRTLAAFLAERIKRSDEEGWGAGDVGLLASASSGQFNAFCAGLVYSLARNFGIEAKGTCAIIVLDGMQSCATSNVRYEDVPRFLLNAACGEAACLGQSLEDKHAASEN